MMLNVVSQAAKSLLFQFNAKRSLCIAFRPKIPRELPQLMIGNADGLIVLIISVFSLYLASTLKEILVL